MDISRLGAPPRQRYCLTSEPYHEIKKLRQVNVTKFLKPDKVFVGVIRIRDTLNFKMNKIPMNKFQIDETHDSNQLTVTYPVVTSLQR